MVSFYLLSFSSPSLSGRTLDVYHTTTHGVALVGIYLECRPEMCGTRLAEMQDPKSRQNRHRGTIAQFCRAMYSQPRHVSTIEKILLSSNMSSTCPHNMVNIGPLAAEICWRGWGTLANFNGFRVLTALLHGSQVVSVQPVIPYLITGNTARSATRQYLSYSEADFEVEVLRF